LSTSKQDRVPLYEKTALGIGALAAFFGYAGISILAYPVCNMMLGVSAARIGVALMIPRLWDGFTDPVMGRISDNFHSRFGRRKPFIAGGAIAMGLLFVLIWYVPHDWSNPLKLAWFIVFQILFFSAYTVFAVPYTALTYEMTPDYDERTRVMAFCAFFHKFGELLGGWMLPLATALGIWLVDGANDLSMPGVLAMGWIVGIGIMAMIGSLPGLLVKERFTRKTATQRKVTLTATHRPDFRGGVTVLSADTGELKAVPFFVWNNREPGRMAVWMKEKE